MNEKRNFLSVFKAIPFPAMWVMSRLKSAPKFALVAVILMVPPLLLAWRLYSASTHQMKFNDGEVLGMVYMAPVHDLLDAQQRHWVASVAKVKGNPEQGAVAAAQAQRAAALLKQLDEIDSVYGTDSRWALFVPDGAKKVHDKLQVVKADWATAVDVAQKGSAEDIYKAHDAAMATTQDFVVNYIANFSNLILDPDLDSYWLMDFAIAKGPQLGIDYARTTTKAMIGDPDKVNWAVGLVGAFADANALVAGTKDVNLKTSIETTKDYGNNEKIAKLVGPYDELKTASDKLIEYLKATFVGPMTRAGDPAAPAAVVDYKPLLEHTANVFDKLHRYYDGNNEPLAELAAKRVGAYRSERSLGLVLVILFVLLNAWVFAAFYFNISDSTKSLSDASHRMIAGTTETFTTANRDEIADLFNNFNEINVALIQARALQQRVAEENARTQSNIVELLEVVSNASDGNLTVRAQTSVGSLGNVADAFNLLMESLEGLVGEVSQQVSESERAVQSIAAVARKMATGATSQAKEVVAARQLVDDVAKQITQVSANAEGASAATKRTAETAEQGEKAVENVIHGMESLRANVQSGAKKMKNLGDRSMEITSIVGTISRISEQTNMLALNAAIEAARAGEHGRGFSVVADEVRKLAERATNATKDIEKLVKAINADTSETIKAIEQQTQVVEDESRTVSAAGESLRKIRSASDQSAGLVAGITNVTKTQVDQAQRVAKTMELVASAAHDTQIGAETTVQTINDLVRLSTELRKSIGRFRVSNGAR
jgi:methyl-accepting chemotaxis protein